MSGNFKCKKCHKKWNLNQGRGVIEDAVMNCGKANCCLRNRQLSFIPLKVDIKNAVVQEKPVTIEADELVVEYLEEEPISGILHQKELRRKHGWF